MGKFSIFSVLLSLTVVTVLIELVANDYLMVNVGTNVLGSPESSKEIVEIFDAEPTEQEVAETTQELDEIPKPRTEKAVVTEQLPENPGFGIDQLREAGFFDPYVAPVSAVPEIFGVITVAEKFGDFVTQYQVMEDNTSVGIVQKVQLENAVEASELYMSIKNNADELGYFSVNETNGYGDQSTYLNHNTAQEQVFLVIRDRETVWAVTYLKSLHPKFQSLFK